MAKLNKTNKKLSKGAKFELNTWDESAIMRQIFHEMKAYFKKTSEEFSFLILQYCGLEILRNFPRTIIHENLYTL